MKPLSVCAVFASLLFGAMQSYISSLEGWGAWAAAPALVVPLALSCGVFFAGIIHYIRHRQPLALFWSVIGGFPVGWLIVRRMF